MDIMGIYPGVCGIFIAAVFSGALRYVSTSENKRMLQLFIIIN